MSRTRRHNRPDPDERPVRTRQYGDLSGPSGVVRDDGSIARRYPQHLAARDRRNTARALAELRGEDW